MNKTMFVVALSAALAAAGCERAVPLPTKPSLTAESKAERIDAARDAAKRFGTSTKETKP